MPKVETVEFNGVTFRRYPDAQRRCDRVYFIASAAGRRLGMGRLHEEIWKAANGAIPPGHHIHHIDGDPLNNEPSNLDCLSRDEHMRHHHAGVCSLRKAEHLDTVRPLTKAWHASPEGHEWHRQHAYRSIRAIAPADHVCDHCGATFVTVPKKSNRFCSNACKSAARRKAGLDNVERACVFCGETFVISRYAKTQTCSSACADRLRSRTMTSRP